MNKFYNIKYKNEVLHSKLTAEECSERLQDYADRFFSVKADSSATFFDPKDLKLEEINENG